MKEVHSTLRSARNHRRVNTAMLFAVMVMLGIGLWIGALNRMALTVMNEIASKNTSGIADVKANQDVNRQQYLDYIKDMIDAMNKLQEDNPKLKVPKAPVPRSIPGKVTESDLRRTPQDGPRVTPTPIIKTKTIVKYKKAKPTPTPKPWYKRFDSLR